MGRFDELLRTDVPRVSVYEKKMAHIHLTAAEAAAADPDGLLDGTALTAAVQTITTFANDMPYARNVTVVASAAAETKVTVHGTNIANLPISEELTLNGATPVVGAKAFKTITSAVLPIATGEETIDLGWGDSIALPFLMTAQPLVFAQLGGTLESAAPVVTIDDNEIEKNTVTLDTALGSSKAVDLYLVI